MTQPHSSSNSLQAKRRIAGILLTWIGAAVFVIFLLDRTIALPLPFPRIWYLHGKLCGVFAFSAAIFGLWLQRDPNQNAPYRSQGIETTWRPRIPGRRFRQAILYSRDGCHLCDDAALLLADYAEFLPDVQLVDIDEHPELKERYGLLIPVVAIDGRERFRGRIDVYQLRRLIDNTPPIDEL